MLVIFFVFKENSFILNLSIVSIYSIYKEKEITGVLELYSKGKQKNTILKTLECPDKITTPLKVLEYCNNSNHILQTIIDNENSK